MGESALLGCLNLINEFFMMLLPFAGKRAHCFACCCSATRSSACIYVIFEVSPHWSIDTHRWASSVCFFSVLISRTIVPCGGKAVEYGQRAKENCKVALDTYVKRQQKKKEFCASFLHSGVKSYCLQARAEAKRSWVNWKRAEVHVYHNNGSISNTCLT